MNGDKKVDFMYDYLGRRVGKIVQTWSGGAWVNTTSHYFIYDGNGNVGQLLRYRTSPAETVTLAAHYEYDPYGNTLVVADVDSSGLATRNKFRFSTKWLDDDLTAAGSAMGTTGLYHFEYRPYTPALGRWISRDPIGERGGPNLMLSMFNSPNNAVDPLGMNAGITGGQGHVGIAVDVESQGHCGVLTADYTAEGFGSGQQGNWDYISAVISVPGYVELGFLPGRKVGQTYTVARLIEGSPQQDKRLMEHIANTMGISSTFILNRAAFGKTDKRRRRAQGEWATYSVVQGRTCVQYTDASIDAYLGRDWYVPQLQFTYNWPNPQPRAHWNPPPLVYPGDLITAWDRYGK